MTYDEAKHGIMDAMKWTEEGFARFLTRDSPSAIADEQRLREDIYLAADNPHVTHYDWKWELIVGRNGKTPIITMTLIPDIFTPEQYRPDGKPDICVNCWLTALHGAFKQPEPTNANTK